MTLTAGVSRYLSTIAGMTMFMPIPPRGGFYHRAPGPPQPGPAALTEGLRQFHGILSQVRTAAARPG